MSYIHATQLGRGGEEEEAKQAFVSYAIARPVSTETGRRSKQVYFFG